MAETVQSLRIEVRITGRVVGDDGALMEISEVYDKTFQDGTNTDQVGTVWQDRSRALAATSEELDPQGGLTDFQGAALAMNTLKAMYFRNLDEDSGDFFWVGGAAANPLVNWVGDATDKIKLGPDGIVLIVSPVDGFSVVAGTGDKLKVEAVDTSSYRAILAGDNS